MMKKRIQAGEKLRKIFWFARIAIIIRLHTIRLMTVPVTVVVICKFVYLGVERRGEFRQLYFLLEVCPVMDLNFT